MSLNSRKIIDSFYFKKGMTYHDYRRWVDLQITNGEPALKKSTENLSSFSKLNEARMSRLDKTIEIIPGLKEIIKKIDSFQTWLVLTEAWCGDSAQIIPVFDKIARLNSNISLSFLFRDENPELMDQYLTNGSSRSIPKLIVVDENFEELFTWGPRPKPLQEMLNAMKTSAIEEVTINKEMHRWYTKNKTIALQKEILALLIQVVPREPFNEISCDISTDVRQE